VGSRHSTRDRVIKEKAPNLVLRKPATQSGQQKISTYGSK
jgi:hypothetical protein